MHAMSRNRPEETVEEKTEEEKTVEEETVEKKPSRSNRVMKIQLS